MALSCTLNVLLVSPALKVSWVGRVWYWAGLLRVLAVLAERETVTVPSDPPVRVTVTGMVFG